MVANDTKLGGESFIIPARTLRGSKRDMVEDIDQAIVGLLALRQLIGGGSAPDHLATGGRERRLRWPRFLKSWHSMGFGR